MKTSQPTVRGPLTAAILLLGPLFALAVPVQAATDLPGALDAPSLTWTTGGDANWQGQESIAHDGVDAARSGVIPDSSESWIETTVTGPGTLTYWWKVSSEEDCDYLRIYLDGVDQGSGISGAVDWQEKSVVIDTGSHTIRWGYSKDGSVASGSDTGWVDEVVFTPDGPVMTKSATGITEAGATLNGTVNPAGLTTTAVFEYGTTTSYGSTVNVTLSPDNGVVPQNVSAPISGLQAGTVYHYRLVATNSGGTVTGTDRSFKTLIDLPGALDAPSLTWTTGGDANWQGQDSTSHDGVDAAKSGLTDGGSSWVETTVTGPGTLTFWWKTQGYGELHLTLDNNDQTYTSSGSWNEQTMAINSGVHTVRWNASDFGYGGSYAFTGWVDEVVFTPDGPVMTKSATGITEAGATLNGTVNPAGLTTTAVFEYGTTTSYGSTVNVTLSPDNGVVPQNVSAPISGLQAGTVYHYRLVATNSGGTVTGADRTFTTISPFQYTKANGQVTITGYIGANKVVTTPPTIEGFPVTAIGEYAFEYQDLTSVSITAGVTTIGSQAFYGCGSLTTVSLPNTLTSIGSQAFSECYSLASLTIPNGVTTLGDRVFSYCYALKNMVIPNSVTSLGTGIFSDCENLTSATLPAGMTSIPDSTFYDCSSLATFTIPAGVTSIGSNAFQSCGSLASVTLPSSVTTIGSNAFQSCVSLVSVTLPNNVTSLGDGIFYNCYGLTTVIFPSGITAIPSYTFRNCGSLAGFTIPSGVTTIGSSAFYGCSGLTAITLPSGLSAIGSEAFRACTALTGITVPNSVTSFDYAIFADCTGLTSAILPSGLSSIPSETFHGCTKLTGLLIPSGVTSIGSYAFQSCRSLAGLNIPSGVTSIGDNAFTGCEKLASISVPNSVTSFGYGVFSGCAGLMSATLPSGLISIPSETFYACTKLAGLLIPSGVTSIGSSAFNGCGSLTSLTLPAGLTSIASYAFSDCRSLSGLNIPAGVTTIGSHAFADCDSLTSITIPNSVTNFDYGMFSGCDKLVSATLPSGLTTIPDATFANCTSLVNVTIPAGVTRIGDEAFYGCKSLASITLPAAVADIGEDAFQDCTGLASFVVAGANTTYSSTSGALLNKAKTTLIRCPEGLAGSYAIPGTVTRIQYSAFARCLKLTGVTIPSSVQNIGNSAFAGCTSLTGITIPGSVTSIGDSAFTNCAKLSSVTILSGVLNIGDSAFADCVSLPGITIPGSVTSIGDSAFTNCAKLSSVTIPSSVTNLGDGVFSGCSTLASATLPASVGGIPSATFYRCVNLSAVAIPSGITSIGSSAFYDCGSLANITIPDTVTSIGSSAFFRCLSLRAVTIPKKVSAIGYRAFAGCASLTAISVDALNQNYSSLAGVLFDKDRTTLIKMPEATAGNYAIPNGVSEIQDWAFDNCVLLTSVTIPTTVTSIGESAFRYCRSLTGMTIPTSVTEIGGSAFRHCRSMATLTLNGKISTIEAQTFADCASLKSVTIPESVYYIADYAFSGAVSLERAWFLGDAPSVEEDVFYPAATNFRIHYLIGKKGFTSPTWMGYPTTGLSTFAIPEIDVVQGSSLTDGKSTVSFGNCTIGSAGVLKTFTIRNQGTGNLTGLAVSKLGTDSAQFVVGALGATTLAPGASTTFTVTLKATTLGAKSAALKIASNDADENPFDIALSGTGVGPEIAVSMGSDLTDGKSTVSFGNTNIGSAGIVKTFTIKNTGNANLTGLAVSKSGTHATNYTVGALGATTLAPGASTTFTVTLKATTLGAKSAALKIASNDADENPFDIALSGTGVGPEIAVSMGSDLTDGKSTVSFGNTKIGSAGIVKTFTIKNTGNANLTGLAVSKSGTHATNYTVGALRATTLAPGASTTFTVTLKATTLGAKSAALKIASNDADENPFDIALTGGGLAAAAKSSRLASLWGAAGDATGSGKYSASTGLLTIDGRRYLSLTYQETAGGSAVKRSVEVSSNLVDWFSGRNHTTVVSRAGGIVKVRDNLPLTSGTKRYIRLREPGN